MKGFGDYWVIKIDSIGNKEWDRTYGGTSSWNSMAAIQLTSDGGYLLGGSSWSDKGGDKKENSRGKGDYWIIKIDAVGNKQWDKTDGGYGNEQPTAMESDNDGFLSGGGSESSKYGEKSEYPKGSIHYWILKKNEVGVIIADKTIGGTEIDILQAIQITSDVQYILGDYSYSDTGACKSEMARGGGDFWVVKTSPAVLPIGSHRCPVISKITRLLWIGLQAQKQTPKGFTSKEVQMERSSTESGLS